MVGEKCLKKVRQQTHELLLFIRFELTQSILALFDFLFVVNKISHYKPIILVEGKWQNSSSYFFSRARWLKSLSIFWKSVTVHKPFSWSSKISLRLGLESCYDNWLTLKIVEQPYQWDFHMLLPILYTIAYGDVMHKIKMTLPWNDNCSSHQIFWAQNKLLFLGTWNDKKRK